MANDVYALFFGVHPAIPHYLVRIKILFYNAHGIYFPASSVILFAAVMRIGFGENDINAAGAYAGSCTRPLAPELIPARHIFYGMAFHIAIIGCCTLSFV